MDIKTVTVIGATGTMGKNVAGIFASFGNAKVFCIGRNIENVKKAIPQIAKSVKSDAIINNLIPVDYSHLDKCITESDFIFESLAEDLDLKNKVAKIVGKNMADSAISCTGTSGLSVNTIAFNYPEEKRGHFFGVHMFNPPYNLTLCELIRTDFSDDIISNELKCYLRDVLYRTVVEVNDTPAFLGNRIGFQFINEALIFADMYKDNGGIDYIDAILGPFTGRIMPPIVTSDFVGLDVHKAIVSNIFDNTNDFAKETFILPEYVDDLIKNGHLGKKTGSGLYKTISSENGKKRKMVYDIKSGKYRDIIHYAFPFAEKMKEYISIGDYDEAFLELLNNNSNEAKICLYFLLKYIAYSLYTASSISNHINSCDDVMATGFNWCPPIALYNALSNYTNVFDLMNDYFGDSLDVSEVKDLLSFSFPSKYDYRRFFRAGRY